MLALLLSGCGTGDRNTPPELIAGHDACLECGMIINELRFASGYVDSEGTSHGFDDLGCLARYSEAGRWPVATPDIWVMDYNRRDWRPAADAWFVRSDSLLTPMGYGIVALGDSLDASRLAVHGADVFRYDALSQIANERQGSATQAAPAIKE